MPKRTNEFQQLVALVQHALAKGATVTESAIVNVPGLEGGREIDILVEGPFGPYRLKVAVEAKGLSRKMGLDNFEAVVGKYTGDCRVVVDKVVVVTREGFSDNVVARAHQLGFVLLAMREARATDWSRFGPQILRFQFAPHLCQVWLRPSIQGDPKALLDKAFIVCPHGHRHGTVREFVGQFIQNHVLQAHPQLLNDLCARAGAEPSGQAVADITGQWNGWQVCFEEEHYPFTDLVARLHAVNAVSNAVSTEVEVSGLSGDVQRLQRVQATAGGKTFNFLLPNGVASPHVVVNIADASAIPANAPQPDTKDTHKTVE